MASCNWREGWPPVLEGGAASCIGGRGGLLYRREGRPPVSEGGVASCNWREGWPPVLEGGATSNTTPPVIRGRGVNNQLG